MGWFIKYFAVIKVIIIAIITINVIAITNIINITAINLYCFISILLIDNRFALES
jgi:hypothetical protein